MIFYFVFYFEHGHAYLVFTFHSVLMFFLLVFVFNLDFVVFTSFIFVLYFFVFISVLSQVCLGSRGRRKD